jgi:hypothetical protein
MGLVVEKLLWGYGVLVCLQGTGKDKKKWIEGRL